MKLNRLMGAAIAVATLSACNGEVEKKLKTVYKKQEVQQTRGEKTFTVTQKFGALKVRAGEHVGEASHKPWSSWWYPLNEKTLFYNNDGSASTLEKYDFYASKMFGEATDATYVEEREIYRPSEVAWAGLCHAWAIAAALHPEPKQPKTVGGVKFTVGDQKALLIKTYEKAEGITEYMYGDRYDGNRSDDYDDIYPDQFHKFAQHFLVQNSKPFLMDYDPRFPVWTVPVYKIKFQVEKISDTSAEVVAWVTFASPHVEPDFVGTKRSVKSYKYILNGSWNNGVLSVTDGEWIEDSKTDHPDYLISYPNGIKRGSRNAEIKSEIVDAILK